MQGACKWSGVPCVSEAFDGIYGAWISAKRNYLFRNVARGSPDLFQVPPGSLRTSTHRCREEHQTNPRLRSALGTEINSTLAIGKEIKFKNHLPRKRVDRQSFSIGWVGLGRPKASTILPEVTSESGDFSDNMFLPESCWAT